jgi:hypothetical protein
LEAIETIFIWQAFCFFPRPAIEVVVIVTDSTR